jgi:hypothetical protein
VVFLLVRFRTSPSRVTELAIVACAQEPGSQKRPGIEHIRLPQRSSIVRRHTLTSPLQIED